MSICIIPEFPGTALVLLHYRDNRVIKLDVLIFYLKVDIQAPSIMCFHLERDGTIDAISLQILEAESRALTKMFAYLLECWDIRFS